MCDYNYSSLPSPHAGERRETRLDIMIDLSAFVMTVEAVRRYARHYRIQEKKKEFNIYDTAGL